MSKFYITGGKKLEGEVTLAGNKNSALKLMAAALIADSPTIISNIPKIKDVSVMGELIASLGAKVDGLGGSELTIDPQGMNTHELDSNLSVKIRASVVLAAPLLVKFGKAVLTPPGGDQIGERLLDTHFNLMTKLGVTIDRKDGRYLLTWKEKVGPIDIFLEEASVTATEMGIIMASSLLTETTISGAATEPHIDDLIDMVTKMGVKIEGRGTSTLKITGVEKRVGVTHRVVPDHIEGGTFIVASAITGGTITINDYVPAHYRMALSYFSDLGVTFKEEPNKLTVMPSELVAKRRKFQTRPWPGFPTDLMSPFIVLATQTKGTVLCHDWMYEWRMFFVDDLISMGANIFIADPHRVIISGPTKLMSDVLYSKDIRAGMSMILAALAAEGTSVIRNIEMVERGYERIEERFKSLGADIRREDSSDEKE